jgi:aspartyl-tRNA(Asn)/glutamyl-tRNA(Gln) amidotransferase subunit A
MDSVKPEATLEWAPIEELVRDVVSGKQTALSLVERAYAQIEKTNDTYQAVLSLTQARAIERAKEIDELISKGEKVGRLAGVPFIAKDNFLVYGADMTAASNMLKGFDPPYQSTAIEFLEAEGAICVAKANLDAFAHGASTENSDFMVTKNPYDKTRVAGGSSGGSAASVTLGMAPFALGTDTGGSIRQPASFCGVVGYKPTYGLVSRSGVVAMASSTDTIGVLARSSMDAAIVMDVMAGRDVLDGTTIETLQSIMPSNASLKGKKIGVIKEYFEGGLDANVEKLVRDAIAQLQQAGAIVDEVSLPSISLALAVYYIIVPAELSSNLARHDGQRYQFSDQEADTLQESYELSRSSGFGDEAKRRIMIGAHVLSSGYYDAYYKKAQIVRTKLLQEFTTAFEKFDYLVGPVSPTPAFKIGENSDDPVQMYLQDIMTVAANLVGNPAISVPCGFANGLPVGLQLMAAQKADKELFEIATIYEGLR